MIKLFSLICSLLVAGSLWAQVDFFSALTQEAKYDFLMNNSQVERREISSFMSEQIISAARRAELSSSRADWWLDTILEGDFALTSEVSISKLSVFLYQGQILAYEFEFKAQALKTSAESCQYNEQDESWSGNGCVAGYIVEKSLYDVNDESIENNQYPEFVAL